MPILRRLLALALALALWPIVIIAAGTVVFLACTGLTVLLAFIAQWL